MFIIVIADFNRKNIQLYFLSSLYFFLFFPVIPGIIVGLAVGLYTDQYGTPQL